MTEKIDIIIPAYKAHNTLLKTLLSIAVQQNANNIKVTIINDCCPEGDYQDIIKHVSDLIDIQEIVLEKNSGPGVARQVGIDKTSNPYIMFVDADDLLAQPYAVVNLLKDLKSSDTGRICTGAFIEKAVIQCPSEDITKQPEVIGIGDIPHSEDMTWCFGKIYERAFLEKYDIKFPPTRGNEDTAFNFMCTSIEKFKEPNSIIISDVFSYIWENSREGSITRINEHQYMYDQSICGLIDGLIYTKNWLEKVQIDFKDVLIHYRFYQFYVLCF